MLRISSHDVFLCILIWSQHYSYSCTLIRILRNYLLSHLLHVDIKSFADNIEQFLLIVIVACYCSISRFDIVLGAIFLIVLAPLPSVYLVLQPFHQQSFSIFCHEVTILIDCFVRFLSVCIDEFLLSRPYERAVSVKADRSIRKCEIIQEEFCVQSKQLLSEYLIGICRDFKEHTSPIPTAQRPSLWASFAIN